jgi:predicted RNA-binding Zn-ribbon protein involved in translation (DUF1610 family)
MRSFFQWMRSCRSGSERNFPCERHGAAHTETKTSKQKDTKMKSLKISLLLGAALAAMNLAALAGPDPQVFHPVKSRQELSALKPGTQVAHECPHCGTISISKVGKDHAQADSHTCPVCKMTVTYRDAGGGKGPRLGMIDCVDVKTGKRMTARVCAAHK